MDRIDAMRAFIAVAKLGSFSAAADKLDKSPQLISKYVSQLETHLTTRLLNRTTRKVHLTEAGERYVIRAEQVLNDIDEMESQLGDMQANAKGLLRISAPVAFATLHLAPLIHAFQQQYPDVDIDLQLNDRKVDIVEEGFDIALRIGNLKNSSLIARRLTTIRMVLCAAPAYLAEFGTPDSLEALKSHNYLRYSYLDADNGPLPHQYLVGTTHDQLGKLSCNHGGLLSQVAVLGQGIVLQPTFICYKALQAGSLSVILPEHTPEPIHLYAVYAHRQLLASKVRAFIDFASQYFGETPYWDSVLSEQLKQT
ncbi:DNA-binding transcriptional regulator, LysR family [Marisediminitalea aggregata]|uniref:DNA-binding transcriptional regulator, LysR family n=1 Tax=Marisediminitalea aggregata TaxID=634436 RepID=A0A1M5Q9E2_9ALTE|nr:LysR family transcriptional regulator [Marisediminitalea aggregata]MEC7824194.1 LysR substrate-binding domain-containing protein [Pseudomonadota bacterium]SHH10777.1 DNA-binding transcriptional regulator, LysR family [Marisediminitalea aggregata]